MLREKIGKKDGIYDLKIRHDGWMFTLNVFLNLKLVGTEVEE
jgi:hypothetical protein